MPGTCHPSQSKQLIKVTTEGNRTTIVGKDSVFLSKNKGEPIINPASQIGWQMGEVQVAPNRSHIRSHVRRYVNHNTPMQYLHNLHNHKILC